MSYSKPLSIVCIAVWSFALPAAASAQHRGGGGGGGGHAGEHAAGGAAPRGAVVAGPRGAVVAGPRGAVVAGHGYPGYPVYGYGHPRYVYPRVVGVYPYHPYYYPYRPGITVGFYSGFGVGFGFGYPYYYGYPYAYPYYGYAYPYPYPYSYYPYANSAPPAPASYVNAQPGVAYGGVRIEGAPRDAQVFVDSNYMGVVEDFDGPDRHLNLPAGAHQIEIRVAGIQPIAFDVNVQGGRTVSVHADVR